jgi:hypothetical protein
MTRQNENGVHQTGSFQTLVTPAHNAVTDSVVPYIEEEVSLRQLQLYSQCSSPKSRYNDHNINHAWLCQHMLTELSIFGALLYVTNGEIIKTIGLESEAAKSMSEAYSDVSLQITAHPLGQRSPHVNSLVNFFRSNESVLPEIFQRLRDSHPEHGDSISLEELIYEIIRLDDIQRIFSISSEINDNVNPEGNLRQKLLYFPGDQVPFNRIIGLCNGLTILNQDRGAVWADADGLEQGSTHKVLEPMLKHLKSEQDTFKDRRSVSIILRNVPPEIPDLVNSIDLFTDYDLLESFEGIVLSQTQSANDVRDLYDAMLSKMKALNDQGKTESACALSRVQVTIFLESRDAIEHAIGLVSEAVLLRDEAVNIYFPDGLPDEFSELVRKPSIGYGMSDLSKDIGAPAAFGWAIRSYRALVAAGLVSDDLIYGGSSCVERSFMKWESAQFIKNQFKSINSNVKFNITVQDDQIARMLRATMYGILCSTTGVLSDSYEIEDQDHVSPLSTAQYDEAFRLLEHIHIRLQNPLIEAVLEGRKYKGITGGPYSERPGARPATRTLTKQEEFQQLRAIGVNHDIYALGITMTAVNIGQYFIESHAKGESLDVTLKTLSCIYPHWKEALKNEVDCYYPELFKEVFTYLYVSAFLRDHDPELFESIQYNQFSYDGYDPLALITMPMIANQFGNLDLNDKTKQKLDALRSSINSHKTLNEMTIIQYAQSYTENCVTAANYGYELAGVSLEHRTFELVLMGGFQPSAFADSAALYRGFVG